LVNSKQNTSNREPSGGIDDPGNKKFTANFSHFTYFSFVLFARMIRSVLHSELRCIVERSSFKLQVRIYSLSFGDNHYHRIRLHRSAAAAPGVRDNFFQRSAAHALSFSSVSLTFRLKIRRYYSIAPPPPMG
jgi:hypothetical protein